MTCGAQSPAMAAQLAQTQQIANAQTPEQRERLIKLKSDPELKALFDEIQSNGAGAYLLLGSCLLLMQGKDRWTAAPQLPSSCSECNKHQ